AITSVAPSLSAYRVELSLACILVLTLGNLRGVRESGLLFALPTYAFIASMYAVLVVGFAKGITGSWPHAKVPHPLPVGTAGSLVYYLVQAFTLAILILAANTSFQGFPRLAALLARDGYFPRQFVNLGDRLVFSNGMLILAGLASVLILSFRANVDSLIHLYV